jgi:hypothetical protein
VNLSDVVAERKPDVGAVLVRERDDILELSARAAMGIDRRGPR